MSTNSVINCQEAEPDWKLLTQNGHQIRKIVIGRTPRGYDSHDEKWGVCPLIWPPNSRT